VFICLSYRPELLSHRAVFT